MTVMETAEIQALIPNRYPIFYIDRVTQLDPDHAITAEKYVSVAEDHLCSYLPAALVMPPTLIIETLAQAASVLILKSPRFAGRTAYLASVDDCQFLAAVPTGSVLTLAVEMGKVRDTMGVVTTQARIGTQVVATAELHFIVSAA
ncbi:3-hydroxyacyl-ACP dehydratase FabZ family protein [Lacticaseibacillus absianus]|uniref:3-hydroxyacyl-ACP dehydratase FabZ family protein n=1 Tax=Lacticaseibacillus absianus TaxID=2729623 RepID=UPI0015C75ECB|nr:3-hydroxyacyl-ACP dehydratase FabZ family protein [Lacticaseibacillus absianus]